MVVKIYKFEKSNYGKLQAVTKQDHFARNGYIIREGKALGISEEGIYYLYIDGPEGFFQAHEKEILDAGGKPVEGSEYDLVKDAIEKEESNVASGIALFG